MPERPSKRAIRSSTCRDKDEVKAGYEKARRRRVARRYAVGGKAKFVDERGIRYREVLLSVSVERVAVYCPEAGESMEKSSHCRGTGRTIYWDYRLNSSLRSVHNRSTRVRRRPRTGGPQTCL